MFLLWSMAARWLVPVQQIQSIEKIAIKLFHLRLQFRAIIRYIYDFTYVNVVNVATAPMYTYVRVIYKYNSGLIPASKVYHSTTIRAVAP
jgi:hypothetical protein